MPYENEEIQLNNVKKFYFDLSSKEKKRYPYKEIIELNK